ncbi:hypothetical protein [Roseovarius aestuariivivens]|uniref:hypothetical protein n=1 Tax=Roseovarius aestuariivivens TaxID=1888910 RepID=UPI001081F25A|nr:hypothetical protein [Roseovarius aestuariivivens]
MAKTVCSFAIWILILLYVGAVFIFLVGTFGWFGEERDPLSGVFLLPLGLPWNLLFGALDDSLRPWLSAAAPIVNIVILKAICNRVTA